MICATCQEEKPIVAFQGFQPVCDDCYVDPLSEPAERTESDERYFGCERRAV